MVVVRVSKKSVKTSHNRQQVLRRGGWDRDPGVEICCVLKDCGTVVNRVNHVVDGGALLRLLMCSTHIKPSLVGSHLGARLGSALLEELNDE